VIVHVIPVVLLFIETPSGTLFGMASHFV